MTYTIEIECYPTEPKFCVRSPALPGHKQTASGGYKHLGRAVSKIIEKLEQQAAKEREAA